MTALDSVKAVRTALMMADYNGKPLPVSFTEESYEHIVALLEQRRAELA